jgi:chemotaxis protein histidine kinase CheA
MGMNALVHKVLTEVGIKEERFALQWASAAEAPRFVKLITEFTGKIKELGPLGEAEGIEPGEIKKRLDAALGAVNDRKVRMFFGNATKSIRKEGIFTQEYINGVIDEKLTKAVTKALSPPEEEPVAEKKVAKPTPKKAPAKKAEKPKKAAAKKPAKKAAAKAKPAAKKEAKAKKAAPQKASATKAKAATPKKKAAPAKKKAAPKKTAKKKK